MKFGWCLVLSAFSLMLMIVFVLQHRALDQLAAAAAHRSRGPHAAAAHDDSDMCVENFLPIIRIQHIAHTNVVVTDARIDLTHRADFADVCCFGLAACVCLQCAGAIGQSE